MSAEGSAMSAEGQKTKILRTGLPGRENVPTPRRSISMPTMGSRLPYRAKFQFYVFGGDLGFLSLFSL